MEPTIFKPRLKFKPPLKFFKFGHCFGGIKYYLFAAEQIRNFYIEDHEMMRKNAGKFLFSKLNKNYKKQSINNHD